MSLLKDEVAAIKTDVRLSDEGIQAKTEINRMTHGKANTQLNQTMLSIVSEDLKLNRAQVYTVRSEFKMLGKQLNKVKSSVYEASSFVQNTSSFVQKIWQKQLEEHIELRPTKLLAQNMWEQLERLQLAMITDTSTTKNILSLMSSEVASLRR